MIHKIDTPEAFPVCFGIIDIIRVLKTGNIPVTKKTKLSTLGDTNEDVCNIHSITIRHWCHRCQVWICDKCLDSHSTLLGYRCSTSNLESKKEEHLNNNDMLLATFEEGANHMSNEMNT